MINRYIDRYVYTHTGNMSYLIAYIIMQLAA